jgi:hypothetical protein
MESRAMVFSRISIQKFPTAAKDKKKSSRAAGAGNPFHRSSSASTSNKTQAEENIY